MLTVRKTSDIWSALMQLVPVARSQAIAFISKKGEAFYIGHAQEVSPDAIVELQNFDLVLLIVEGKPTKSKLNDAERTYWTERVRESNAWLN